MDMECGKKQLLASIRKYQYILYAVLAGIFLMLLPPKAEEPQIHIPSEQTYEPDLEKKLSAILTQISGVGDAEVLLTEASGSETIYQMDIAQNHNNQDTVIVLDDNRREVGLIKQVLSPEYKGAVVVCKGADDANVRLSVVAAVKSVTGLSSDRITVLKMK